MSKLIDLQRCWRSAYTPSKVDGGELFRWWLSEENTEMLERFGFHRISSLAKYECLFLLGRPGAGKTAEIERIESGEVSGFSDEHCLVIPCKEMTGPEVDQELQRNPAWRVACHQTKPVRLILDALDEGFLRDNNYFAPLKRSLGYIRAENPKLRLALVCRPAEWDETFGRSVHSTWGGEGEPAVYTLEPLSRPSQYALAQSWGVENRSDFFTWIGLNNFEEFALWPRSLKWLAEYFRADGAVQVSYSDLCRRRVLRSFPEDKRIMEADRADQAQVWTQALMVVAATLVFCGRSGIALGESDELCLTLDEIFHRCSSLGMPGKADLTRENVREAVRKSDLMEAHGKHHRFQNQSDLEYLAADTLASLKNEQLSELFGCDDEEGNWRVFPQLATTAANLATQSHHFFQWLLEHDPRVLLRMDFASKSMADKEAAVEAVLLATAEANATADHDRHAHFATLQHTNIEDQLRPWIFNPIRPRTVRSLAFDIAFACCGMQFWEEFNRAAREGSDDFLDPKQASVLHRFGKKWPGERLCEIASQPHSRNAAGAMHALLDKGWTPGALAPFIRETTGHTYDGYDILLGSRLIKECSADDVPALLTKIATWPESPSRGGHPKTLEEALIAHGVRALYRTDIREAIVKFIIVRSGGHGGWLDATRPEQLARFGLDDPEARRALMLALADALPLIVEPPAPMVRFPLLEDDYFWLFAEVAKAQGVRATNLARLVCGALWQLKVEYADALDHAYNACGELRALLPLPDGGSIFKTLCRLRAEREATQQLEMEKYRAQLPRTHRYNHEVHFVQALSRCRAGRIADWVQLCIALAHPKSEYD